MTARIIEEDRPRFTPGPWKLSRVDQGTVLAGAGHSVGMALASVVQFLPAYRKESDANAHLISAAPDMYEADADALDTIEKLIADLREEDASRHAQRIAVLEICADNLRAAIAKAHGQLTPPFTNPGQKPGRRGLRPLPQ